MIKKRFPEVCVYITTFNYGNFLREAIESVLKQTYDNWELFLINDGSTDNSKKIIDDYKSHPKVKILNTKKIGLFKIANKVLKLTKAKYIMRLDADDVFDENILLVLTNHMQNDSKLALIYPDYYYMDLNGVIFASERRQNINYNKYILDIPPNGACTMIRTSILKKVGGYSDNLLAQDGYDIWNKIIKKYKFKNVNTPLFYYRRHGKNLTSRKNIIIENKRKIKSKYSIKKLKVTKPILAIIPCRKHFDFVDNLWDQKIGKENILNHILNKIKMYSSISNIIISSDNIKIKKNLRKEKKINFLKRSTELTIRSRPIVDTLEKIFIKFDKKLKGISIIWPVQCPNILLESVKEAVNTLLLNDADSCIIVNEISTPVFQRQETGLRQITNNGFLISDFDKLYLDTRSLIVIKNSNILKGSLLGSKVTGINVFDDETLYIDNQTKLEFIKFLNDNRDEI